MWSLRAALKVSLCYACLTLVLSGIFVDRAAAHSGHKADPAPPQILAPGYRELTFTAPAAGTYTLPVLGLAGDGKLLTSDGNPVRLAQFYGDKPVLLSFIYTSCDDVNGCPLASYVMAQVVKRVAEDDSLADQVRMLSISFDPSQDTPAMMREYGKNFRPAGADWRFLTCANVSELEPILTDYNQSVAFEYDAEGKPTSRYSHILRVFLIDKARQIRNIYSVSFLHADTIINDLKTVLLDDSAARPVPTAATGPRLHGAGDSKQGYAAPEYETKSQYLPSRTGAAQDLLAHTSPPPLGLPALPVPRDNPLTVEKIALGRKLFFDRRLSLNGTISCAMCHVPEQGFAHNELGTAIGFEGRTVRRNAPTIYNVAYLDSLFHDARDDSLEHQIWQPLLARNEMANPSVSAVINKIRRLPDYQGLFESAFDGAPVDIAKLGKALASYQRAIVSANSAFDRWHFGREVDAMNAAAQRGFALFRGKAGCSACHLVGDTYALFTDQKLHNTGVGYARSMALPPTKPQRVLLAPGTYIDVDPDAVAESAEKAPSDLGYYEITQDPADRWKYRTPTLRNIALTAPYMHDGSLTTLEAVIAFYNRGGIKNPLLDPLIRPLGLSESEQSDLLEFLRTLTGTNIDVIISDAFAAPVGNTTTESP